MLMNTRVYTSKHNLCLVDQGGLKICHSTAALEPSLLHVIWPCTVGKWSSPENSASTLFTRSITSSFPNLSTIVSQEHPTLSSEKRRRRRKKKHNSRHIATLPISTPNLDTTIPQPRYLRPRHPVAAKVACHPKAIVISSHTIH